MTPPAHPFRDSRRQPGPAGPIAPARCLTSAQQAALALLSPASGSRWLSALRIPALFLALACLLFWPLTAGGQVLFWGVPLLQQFPWRSFAVHEWLAGRVPLWNPYAGFGAPLAANFQSAVFYPLNVWYLFVPIERAMTLSLLVHLALAGWSMCGYTRRLGVSAGGALLAGIAFAFSGFLVAQANFFNLVSAVAWLPAIFWSLEAVLQTPESGGARRHVARSAAALALAVALLLLAGYIQGAAYGLALAVAYLAMRGLPLVARRRFRLPAVAAGAILLGVALAAVQLLPGWELSSHSLRHNGLDYEDAAAYSVSPAQLITTIAPGFFGTQASGDWWGPGVPWEGVLYAGILPVLLAAAALARRKASPPRVPAFFALSALAGLFLAAGRFNPIFPILFDHLPGLSLFHAPARFVLWYSFALAVLAGLGWDCMAGARAHRVGAGGRLLLVAGASLLAGTAALGWAAPPGRLAGTSTPALMAAALWVTACGGLLLALPRLGRVSAAGGALLLLADLFAHHAALVPATDAALYTFPPPAVVTRIRAEGSYDRTLVTDAAYNKAVQTYFNFHGPFRSRWEDLRQLREAMIPNLATAEGLYEAHNYDPLRLQRQAALLGRAEGRNLPEPLLDVMGVRFLFDPEVVAAPWQQVQVAPVPVYRRPSTLPRAYVVADAMVASSAAAALDAVSRPGFDPHTTVVLEAPGDRLPAPRSAGAAAAPAVITRYAPDRVSVQAAGPGVLVLADSFYPGWHARVDGAAAPIYPANAAFRGVILPPGEHAVEFIYRPLSFALGFALSVAGLAALAGLLAFGVLPARRP